MRGTLIKRSEGSWSIKLSLGRDPVTGKYRQQWVTVRGTKKEAERKLAELLHQMDTGGFVKPSRLTVGAFLDQWLRDYAANAVRPRTLQRYRSIVECHLKPDIGGIPLAQLQPSHVQAAYAKALTDGRLSGKGGPGLSAKSVLQQHRIFNQALSHAVKWGLVARNVAEAVDPPRAVNKETRPLSGDEVGIFLDAAQDSPYYSLFHLDIYTGLRRSEILGLRWRDVDLDMATLSIVQALHRLPGGKTVFLEPKTAKGRRVVALSPMAVLALRAHRQQQEELRAKLEIPWSEDMLVFSHPDGSPLAPDTISHAFSDIARKAGLHGVRLHDLRHTHATLMLQQGVHPKIVQERLGHSTIAITLDTYSHVTPSLQQAAALRFDEGLARRSRGDLAGSSAAKS